MDGRICKPFTDTFVDMLEIVVTLPMLTTLDSHDIMPCAHKVDVLHVTHGRESGSNYY